eukprot:m.368838 g.368838  ORF g.368838 m.368838 type:complete len:152 (+) comp16670_c0_seq4:216-671(+)
MGRRDDLDEILGIKKSGDQDNIVTNLTKVPLKDKGVNATKFNVHTKNSVHQADLLFLPNDNGYRYALVVVDVVTRSMDAQQLKSKKPEVVRAFKAIYKRKYLSMPNYFLHVDPGTEFKGATKEYLFGSGKQGGINSKLMSRKPTRTSARLS